MKYRSICALRWSTISCGIKPTQKVTKGNISLPKKPLIQVNLVSTAISPIEEMIRNKFRWDEGLHEHLSATQICEAIGLQNPSQHQTRQAAAAVRNIKGIQTFDRKGAKTFHMPKPYYS